jgi:hypothetical protein
MAEADWHPVIPNVTDPALARAEPKLDPSERPAGRAFSGASKSFITEHWLALAVAAVVLLAAVLIVMYVRFTRPAEPSGKGPRTAALRDGRAGLRGPPGGGDLAADVEREERALALAARRRARQAAAQEGAGEAEPAATPGAPPSGTQPHPGPAQMPPKSPSAPPQLASPSQTPSSGEPGLEGERKRPVASGEGAPAARGAVEDSGAEPAPQARSANATAPGASDSEDIQDDSENIQGVAEDIQGDAEGDLDRLLVEVAA